MRRRGEELLVRALRTVAGRQIVEELGQVLADERIAGEEPEVAVDARGARMVVAGADVRVAAEPIVILAHDEQHLAVRLQADDPVRDVDAEVLEPAREFEKLRQPKSVRPGLAIPPSRSPLSVTIAVPQSRLSGITNLPDGKRRVRRRRKAAAARIIRIPWRSRLSIS